MERQASQRFGTIPRVTKLHDRSESGHHETHEKRLVVRPARHSNNLGEIRGRDRVLCGLNWMLGVCRRADCTIVFTKSRRRRGRSADYSNQ